MIEELLQWHNATCCLTIFPCLCHSCHVCAALHSANCCILHLSLMLFLPLLQLLFILFVPVFHSVADKRFMYLSLKLAPPPLLLTLLHDGWSTNFPDFRTLVAFLYAKEFDITMRVIKLGGKFDFHYNAAPIIVIKWCPFQNPLQYCHHTGDLTFQIPLHSCHLITW